MTALPQTPADRWAFIMDLLHPVDPDTGEELEPLITPEQARALLDYAAPSGSSGDPA